MTIKGKVWKFKDNIDTDVIIPARYLNTSDPKELALHCMEDYDPEFVKKMNQGDIIVAGRNFGCGSSREHAPIALKAAGVSCIIAPVDQCSPGDILEVDTAKGIIKNLSKDKVYKTNLLPEFIQKVISVGGLREYVKEELKRRKINV
jgi:3-isopropylmalate/(R)-2-methylmalate dehydratase small subunit